MSDCSGQRYEKLTTVDKATGVVSQCILEHKDGAGNVHDPAILHLPGSDGYIAALADMNTCDGTPGTEWKQLCDPVTDLPVMVECVVSPVDETETRVFGLNKDGTPYTGDLNALIECPDSDNDGVPDNGAVCDMVEETYCDAGVTKRNLIIRDIADPTNPQELSNTWWDVTGAATTAPVDPTLVTAGACASVGQVNSSMTYCC